MPTVRSAAATKAGNRSEAEIAYKVVLDLDTVRTLVREAHDLLGTDSRAGLRRAPSR